MAEIFRRVGLIGKHDDPCIRETILRLSDYLLIRNHEILLEDTTSQCLGDHDLPLGSLSDLAEGTDLVIVVGGDGTMLHAARALAANNVPLLGINLGRLGFLADVSPDDMVVSLDRIFEGDYEEEHRLLLQATVGRGSTLEGPLLALNDVVLHKWNIARMIEVETYINGRFVFTQRSDGLIVSTPTGSTAYALSGGGPLIHPELDALVLVPICPHTLSNRPLVIGSESQVELLITGGHHDQVRVSCDGQLTLELGRDESICVRKAPHRARLIHPRGHDHFDIMRVKLGWAEHPIR